MVGRFRDRSVWAGGRERSRRIFRLFWVAMMAIVGIFLTCYDGEAHVYLRLRRRWPDLIPALSFSGGIERTRLKKTSPTLLIECTNYRPVLMADWICSVYAEPWMVGRQSTLWDRFFYWMRFSGSIANIPRSGNWKNRFCCWQNSLIATFFISISSPLSNSRSCVSFFFPFSFPLRRTQNNLCTLQRIPKCVRRM